MTDNWIPINGYPGDQRFEDIRSPDPDVSYWGEIGTNGRAGWSWTIVAMSDTASWDQESGAVSTEDEAKRAVEEWRP